MSICACKNGVSVCVSGGGYMSACWCKWSLCGYVVSHFVIYSYIACQIYSYILLFPLTAGEELNCNYFCTGGSQSVHTFRLSWVIIRSPEQKGLTKQGEICRSMATEWNCFVLLSVHCTLGTRSKVCNEIAQPLVNSCETVEHIF